MQLKYNKVHRKKRSTTSCRLTAGIGLFIALVCTVIFLATTLPSTDSSTAEADFIVMEEIEKLEAARNRAQVPEPNITFVLEHSHANDSQRLSRQRTSLHWTSADFGSINIDRHWPKLYDYQCSKAAENSAALGLSRSEFIPASLEGLNSVGVADSTLLRESAYDIRNSSETLHVVISFADMYKVELERTLVSLDTYSRLGGHTVMVHLIGPSHLTDRVVESRLYSLNFAFYSLDLCIKALENINGLISVKEPVPKACVLVLDKILPKSLDYVVHLEPGMTFVSHAFSRCWAQPDDSFTMFQAGISGDFQCQVEPGSCLPAPFSAACVTTKHSNVLCPGSLSTAANFSQNFPYSSRQLQAALDPASLNVYTVGPMQVSTSTMGISLKALRKEPEFFSKLRESSVRVARLTDRVSLTTQQILNNYIRLFPLSHSLLPCECNHHVSWPRPDLVCPNKELLILNPETGIAAKFASQLVEIFRGFNSSMFPKMTPIAPVYAALVNSVKAQLVFDRQSGCIGRNGDCSGKLFWSGSVPEISSLVQHLAKVESNPVSGNETKFPADSSASVGPAPPLQNTKDAQKKVDPNFKPVVNFNESATVVTAAGFSKTSNSSVLPKVTVIIQSFNADGYRPQWLISSLRQYVSKEFQSIVDRVILVWNNPDVPAPQVPESVTALSMKRNSLNNRWIQTLPYINTEAVLNLDDDMFVDINGIECMMRAWLAQPNQNRMVGPFARYTNNGQMYSMSEMFDGGHYEVILPRTAILHRRLIELYAKQTPDHIKQYVDDQEAHCDDIALTMAITNATHAPPLRIILPESSVTDYFSCADNDRQNTGGLALQRSRSKLRAQCVHDIHQSFGNFKLYATDGVATCTASSTGKYQLGKYLNKKLDPRLFIKMKARVNCSSFHFNT